MNLKDILAISGHPGLYKFISQGKNSIIVESLADKKRFAAYASSKVSALKDVAIFTNSGETPLKDVFQTIYEREKGGMTLNPKSSSDDQMKTYFTEILPDYDKEKVYLSDIRKVFSWYNSLNETGLLSEPDPDAEKNAEAAPAEDSTAGNEENTVGEEKPAEEKKPGKTRKK
jgi:hypothetical protein